MLISVLSMKIVVITQLINLPRRFCLSVRLIYLAQLLYLPAHTHTHTLTQSSPIKRHCLRKLCRFLRIHKMANYQLRATTCPKKSERYLCANFIFIIICDDKLCFSPAQRNDHNNKWRKFLDFASCR